MKINISKGLDTAWKDYIAALKSNCGTHLQANSMLDVSRCRVVFWNIAIKYDRQHEGRFDASANILSAEERAVRLQEVMSCRD